MQPDAYNCGGILTLRKISALAEGFGIPCIPHGTHGLGLAGWLQVVGALPNCRSAGAGYHGAAAAALGAMGAAGTQLLNGESPFHIEGTVIEIPQGPGLGLDV